MGLAPQSPGVDTLQSALLSAGKTTLLRLIAGLEQPNSGRVYFDGEDITEYGVQDRDLGFVFQVRWRGVRWQGEPAG